VAAIFAQHRRMPVRIAQHAGTKPQPRGVAGQGGQCRPALQQGQRSGAPGLALLAALAGLAGDAGIHHVVIGTDREEVVAQPHGIDP